MIVPLLNYSVSDLRSRFRLPILLLFVFSLPLWLLPGERANARLTRPISFQQDAAESRLAAAVIAAHSDNERAALIQSQPQLVNQRFRFETTVTSTDTGQSATTAREIVIVDDT